MSRRRIAVNPNTMAAAIVEPTRSRMVQQDPARSAGVEQRHPEPGTSDRQTRPNQDPAGPPVPLRVPATQPSGDLERAEEGVNGRRKHVHHQGRRGGLDARVDGHELRAASSLDQSQ